MEKDIEYYMNLPYLMKLVREDNDYLAWFPDMPGCACHAPTATLAVEGVLAAQREWLEKALVTGIKIHEPR